MFGQAKVQQQFNYQIFAILFVLQIIVMYSRIMYNEILCIVLYAISASDGYKCYFRFKVVVSKTMF